MKILHYYDSPVSLHGVPNFKNTGILERLPESVRNEVPTLQFLGRRTPGARLRFKTNAKSFSIRIYFEKISVDVGMSIYAAQSAAVMIGERYAGFVLPINQYKEPEAFGEFKKDDTLEQVTVFLPRNEVITDIVLEFPDDAKILHAEPYTYQKPVLFYGSSITEGAHVSRVTNAYNALLSAWLDTDYYNLGFSGSAKGEEPLAKFISSLDISAFVMDYDHNAPDYEHLKATHQNFFNIVRNAKPDLPIILMSRPDFDYDAESPKRREVIKKTYQDAKDKGDTNVYFIDGQTFFGTEDRHYCTSDLIHPNDLGMYRMAKTIYPVLKEVLENLK